MKGGENMNVGMQGLMQTMVQPETSHQTSLKTSKSGFTSLFATLVQNNQQQVEMSTQSPFNLSKDTLEMASELFDFLQINDLEEVEGGQQLIAETALTQSMEDLFQIIMRFLGITTEEWQTLLDKVTHSIDLPELNHLLDSEDADDQLHALMQIFTFLSQLGPEQLVQVVQNDVTNIVKAGKLVDLLLAYQDQYEEANNKQREKLANDLNEIKDKLGELLQVSKQSSRQTFLQRTFTTVNNEANHSLQTQSVGEAQHVHSLSAEIPRTEGVTNPLFQFQQVSKAEQLTLMAENNGKPVTPEQLMKQFNSILSKSQFLKEGGTQRLFIKLYPEHLGAMRVELIQKNQTMIARILTTTAMAREMLDSQLHSLKQAFSNQNIQVERIEVSQQLSQQDRFLQKDNEARQQHDQRGDTKKDEQEERATFEDTFEDVLLNVEV